MTVTDADRERALIEAIINAYHTTRLSSDYVPHISGKATVQKALKDYRIAAEQAGARKMQEAAAKVALEWDHPLYDAIRALDPEEIVK